MTLTRSFSSLSSALAAASFFLALFSSCSCSLMDCDSLFSLFCRLDILLLPVAAEAGYTVAVTSRQMQARHRLTARTTRVRGLSGRA